MKSVYAIFHLNLAYSSISAERRLDVIERCYNPLLDLIENHNLPLGIELTGWTLNEIKLRAPHWIARFKSLLEQGRCELIGSGYCQIIGPLVPGEMNLRNQQLGLQSYQHILGQTPHLALVNELAYSTGLVDIYHQVGYQGLIVDYDNVHLTLQQDPPHYAQGCGDVALPVLWGDSILFQRLQRYAHGDITQDDYLEYLQHRIQGDATTPLSLYCNDAEVFNFRPGRFKEESDLHIDNEWQRIETLFSTLAKQHIIWCSPSDALTHSLPSIGARTGRLTNITNPVPVKKQAKYNISRWAVSGRNDLWLNSLCHNVFQALKNTDNTNDELWQHLCECWASDIRTHITNERWQEAKQKILQLAQTLGVDTKGRTHSANIAANKYDHTQTHDMLTVKQDDEGIYLYINTPQLQLTLNARRGLSIHSLAFKSQGFTPVVGTLKQGHFKSIELGADFYSGLTLVELPGEHKRITDLSKVEPSLYIEDNALIISAAVHTEKGGIHKTIHIPLHQEWIRHKTEFTQWDRSQGIVRLGTVTLLRQNFLPELELRCHNGGIKQERFALNLATNHGAAASTLISCSTGLGATTGNIQIGDQDKAITLSWSPELCAAMPLVKYQTSAPDALTRIHFSLSEVDETSHPEGELPAFEFSITPSRLD